MTHSIHSIHNVPLESLIRQALIYQKSSHRSSLLHNEYIASVFFEPSTRTKTSFEVAVDRLGGKTIHFQPNTSSLTKNETKWDTLNSFNAMGIHHAIVRDTETNITQHLASAIQGFIINAGDGTNEHPSQALLDLALIQSQFGSLKGLTMLIVGDLRRSRVANSHIHALSQTGIHLHLVSPPEFKSQLSLPPQVEVHSKLTPQLLASAQVVMLLRIQKERIDHSIINLNSSESAQHYLESYHHNYGFNRQRLAQLNPKAILLHPGPFNVGIELTQEVLSDPRCLITHQVAMGVFARMALLTYAFKGSVL